MGWQFWRRQPNPLDTESLRLFEERVTGGELRSTAEELKAIRRQKGDSPGLRYLESLVYHEGMAVPAAELHAHLSPALETDRGFVFPEARLLDSRLRAATGALDEAHVELEALSREKLTPALQERVRATMNTIARLRGPDGLRRVEEQATMLAAELERDSVRVRWRLSDLARLDSYIDQHPDKVGDDRARWTALLGEIATRASKGVWQLAPRPEEREIRFEGTSWPVGRALRSRLLTGDALYESIHQSLRTPAIDLVGIPGCSVVVESGVHPTVVADHIARRLQALGVGGLGVFRERLAADGKLILPVSFVDKADVQRVVYIETRPWDSERLSALRRWTWRLRTSAARHAEVSIASATQPSVEAIRLVEGSGGAPAPSVGVLGGHGSRAATPQSIDEPKLRWLDERAEVMERLVRASLEGDRTPDLELVRKLQSTVEHSFFDRVGELTPKQWNALYGYGALYGRILARNFDGRWTGLADDTQPTRWEMRFANGRTSHPLGSVLRLAQLGTEEGDLIAEFTALRAANLGADSA